MAVDLATRLAQAEEAYHALMTGQSVAEFRDQNGELVRYTPANAARLMVYIQTLRQQLGITPACSFGPAGVFF